MGVCVGIDLGTTNSAIAVKRIGTTVLKNSEGDELTPSCLTALPSGTDGAAAFLVGAPAKDLLKQYPDETVISVKRLIGREFEEPDVQKIVRERRYAYHIETDSEEPGSIRIPLRGRSYSPEALSAEILRKIVRDGAAELGGDVRGQVEIEHVVVTVPAYFSDRQKFATRAACEQAGLHLLRLLPEPTAAAIGFGMSEMAPTEAKTLMVFDLGGGTFDVSVLSVVGGHFMEVTKGGDMWIGGDDIDHLVTEFVFERTEKATACGKIADLAEHLPASDRARFVAEMKERAEQAKITLSANEETTVEAFGILRDEHGQLVDIDVTLTRVDFDLLIEPLTRRLTAITEQILAEIRFEPALIDTVLMVGGSSLIPAIQQALRGVFGPEKVQVHPRPMFAVVEGAAIMAHRLAARPASDAADTAMNLMHSTAHDYYLQLASGSRHLLVARNTPLPCTVEEKLVFTQEEQTLARLRVFNDVDGILEAVGELWFHKHQGDPLDPAAYLHGKRHKEKTELVLQFRIDEDNIIHMKTWSTKAPEQKAEAVIARGGLTLRLFADLEKTLAAIAAHATSERLSSDAQALSKQVTDVILGVADPLTGIVRPEQKVRAMRQIAALQKILLTDTEAPLGRFVFAGAVRDSASDVLEPEERGQLDSVIEGLAAHLRALDDADALNAKIEMLEAILDRNQLAVMLTHATFAANCIERFGSREAQLLRAVVRRVVNAKKSGDELAMTKAHDELLEIMSYLDRTENRPNRHFDRDVQLVRQP